MTMSEAAQAIVAQTDWPKNEDAATADALILHGARVAIAMTVDHDKAFAAWNKSVKGTDEHRKTLHAYLEATTSMIAQSQVVVALVETQKRSYEEADHLARTLYMLTEDGGVFSELMWECLRDRNCDPQAVWDAADEERSDV